MTYDFSNNLLYNSVGHLSSQARDRGLENLQELIDYLRSIPYGRSSTRGQLDLVIKENKGTCSSKHALLAAIAIEQGWDFVELILCIYKMDEDNTPGVGVVMHEAGLAYLPEAHCYIKIQDRALDITFDNSNIDRLRPYIIEELSIKPDMVGIWKADYHKEYIKEWTKSEHPKRLWTEMWSLREACIRALEAK